MVSKVAVIALVLIIACPILMGYAMNLSEITVTEYEKNNDTVNVTPLLQNGTSYTTANGDLYQLNTQFTRDWDDLKVYPVYEKTSSVKSSLPLNVRTSAAWSGGGGINNLNNVATYFLSVNYEYSATAYASVDIYHNSTLLHTVNHVAYVYYDGTADTLYYTLKNSVNSLYTAGYTGENITGMIFRLTGIASLPITYGVGYLTNNSTFTDISAGFHFTKDAYSGSFGYFINLPEKTSKALLSINLDSITASSYTASIFGVLFQKTTTAGVVTWTATVSNYPYSQTYDLYYDPSISNNTYQLMIDYSDNSEPSDDPFYPDPYRKYSRHIELRYVGGWQQFIGEANYYQKYDFDYYQYRQPNDSYLKTIGVGTGGSRSLTIRMDAATFQAFQYQVIEDQTYDPSAFKTYPSTEIASIQKYGTQLVFGGNTYSVKNGNITLGTHSIPVEGLIFSSVPNESGTYDNKIGNTIVSTTVDPSTIQFVGKWAASVSTASMSQTTYTKTEWTPGQFAWNGLDQNFLMVGLLTSIGAFIGLAIFMRRTKAALWPLLIVCGGAAMLFFIML